MCPAHPLVCLAWRVDPMGGAKSVATVLHQTTLRCSRAARGCPLARLQAAALHAFGFRFGSLRRFLMHPMVRVHFVDVTTQAYLQKTSSRCRVCRAHSASTQASLHMTTPHLHPSVFPYGHGGASLMPHHRKVASSHGSLGHSAAEPGRRCRSLQVIDNAVRESELHPACGT